MFPTQITFTPTCKQITLLLKIVSALEVRLWLLLKTVENHKPNKKPQEKHPKNRALLTLKRYPATET